MLKHILDNFVFTRNNVRDDLLLFPVDQKANNFAEVSSKDRVNLLFFLTFICSHLNKLEEFIKKHILAILY